jgi:HEAT repeat protein
MNKIRVKRISLLILAVLLTIGAVYYSLPSSEPRYQGRVLSLWLEDLDESKPAEARERAKTVLTQAAKEAAPTFVEILRAKDSKFNMMMIAWAGRQNILKLNFQTADVRREEAVREFSRFSTGAIPVLTNLLHDPELAFQAVHTLSGTGPQAAIHLIRALDHTNESVRIDAVMGLLNIYMNSVRLKNFVTPVPGWQGNLPTNAAVAALVKSLKDVSPSVCANATYALGDRREEPESIIPALVENLGKMNPPHVRQSAADTLGKYEQRAIPAVPTLEKLLNDAVPLVREAAEGALRKIDTRKQLDGNEQNK